jgi:hypothetical protein
LIFPDCAKKLKLSRNFLMTRGHALIAVVLVSLGAFIIPGCTPMSNRPFVEKYADYRGINRIAVFLERWPIYRQLQGHGEMQLDFITKDTLFFNAWEPADRIPPRAVDVKDIDDHLMAQLLLDALQSKGYEPFIAGMVSGGRESVAEIMAKYLVFDSQVDGFLFCFYSPTLYFSSPDKVPPEQQRSYSLTEIAQILNPRGGRVVWAGPQAVRSRPDSISHAFIYLSMTMFKALDNQVLWTVAGSQVGGRLRVTVWDCPPEFSEEDYRTDVTVIRRLMINNVRCRLRYMIPDAF